MTNKILKNLILAAVLIVPFIALYVANSMFFPFITGKNFAFRIIIEIIFALWLVLVLRDRSYAPKKSAILYSVLLFLLIMTIADVFGANFWRSFFSNYERMEGLITDLHLLAYLLITGSILNTQKLWDNYFKVILASGFLVSFYSIFQLLGWVAIDQSGFRIDATFGNSAYLAVHMIFLFFIALSYYFVSRDKKLVLSSRVYLILSLLFAVILLDTSTRGSVIGLIVGLIVVSGIFAYHGSVRVKKISAAVILAIIICSVGLIAAKNVSVIQNNRVLGRLANAFDDVQNEPRFKIWGIAYQGFLEHPVLGWGQENFNLIFDKHYNVELYSQEPWFDRAHDVFFDWLTAGGILGLISYLSIFGVALYTIWRRGKKKNGAEEMHLGEKSALTGLLVAYFIHNIFVFDNLLSYIMFFTILSYLHFYSCEKYAGDHVPDKKFDPDREFKNNLLSFFALVCLIVALYFLNLKAVFQSRTLIKALSDQDQAVALTDFKTALAYDTFGNSETREQLVTRAIMVRNANVPDQVKIDFFNLAESELKKQIAINPNDTRYLVFLGDLYLAYGHGGSKDLDKFAEKYLGLALESSPGKQTIMFQIISAMIDAGDYDSAFGVAKTVYEEEKNFIEAAKYYAIAAVYDGKIDSVKNELMAAGVTQSDIDTDIVNYHISMASNDLTIGDRAKSISELELVKKLNPSFTKQADYYISEIKAGRNP